MALIDEIVKNAAQLPPAKQLEALDFIIFLKQRSVVVQPVKLRSLKSHAAFGSWQPRRIDAVGYQQKLRAEWGAGYVQGIKKSLKKLAKMRVFADIKDPVEWQRSQRLKQETP